MGGVFNKCCILNWVWNVSNMWELIRSGVMVEFATEGLTDTRPPRGYSNPSSTITTTRCKFKLFICLFDEFINLTKLKDYVLQHRFTINFNHTCSVFCKCIVSPQKCNKEVHVSFSYLKILFLLKLVQHWILKLIKLERRRWLVFARTEVKREEMLKTLTFN